MYSPSLFSLFFPQPRASPSQRLRHHLASSCTQPTAPPHCPALPRPSSLPSFTTAAITSFASSPRTLPLRHPSSSTPKSSRGAPSLATRRSTTYATSPPSCLATTSMSLADPSSTPAHSPSTALPLLLPLPPVVSPAPKRLLSKEVLPSECASSLPTFSIDAIIVDSAVKSHHARCCSFADEGEKEERGKGEGSREARTGGKGDNGHLATYSGFI